MLNNVYVGAAVIKTILLNSQQSALDRGCGQLSTQLYSVSRGVNCCIPLLTFLIAVIDLLVLGKCRYDGVVARF